MLPLFMTDTQNGALEFQTTLQQQDRNTNNNLFWMSSLVREENVVLFWRSVWKSWRIVALQYGVYDPFNVQVFLCFSFSFFFSFLFFSLRNFMLSPFSLLFSFLAAGNTPGGSGAPAPAPNPAAGTPAPAPVGEKTGKFTIIVSMDSWYWSLSSSYEWSY
mmetsp:Transcript_16551/g.21560  ORF Transcript_16551/g.21560 Transcript_16551/m.21560 type:complete len:160 (+) Transcript_16551:104-583(+)